MIRGRWCNTCALEKDRASMVIVGTWWTCDDGEVRPIIRATVVAGNGQEVSARFLVDTGADRSAFDAILLNQSQLPQQPPPAGYSLEGVGGASPFVVLDTVLKLPREDG